MRRLDSLNAQRTRGIVLPPGGKCPAYVWALRTRCPETGPRTIDNPMRTVRALCVEQIVAAMAAQKRTNNSDIEVHDMRTEIQRARAMLRLLRPCLGNRAYHKENLALRDIARMLTPVRDAKMLVQSFSEYGRDDDKGTVREFRRMVVRKLTSEWRACQRQRRPSAVAALRKVRDRLECFSAAHWNRKSVGTGVTCAYKRGRNDFRRVLKNPTDGNLHEWRKQVKYFVYQLEALTSERGYFAGEHGRSSQLAECLGEDHDLAVLQQKVVQLVKSLTPACLVGAREVWSHRLSRRRAYLQKRALRLAEQIYAQKPVRFGERLEKALFDQQIDRDAA